MTPKLSILMAQINSKVGALQANAKLIKNILEEHQKTHDLIIFPELALSGYPPEDLLLRPAFMEACLDTLEDLKSKVKDCYVLVGHPSCIDGKLFNSASLFYQHKRVALYHKQVLPNYGVFDEKRYFSKGPARASIVTIKGYKTGICICEDLWGEAPIQQIIKAKADLLVCINASPFEWKKPAQREALLRKYAREGLTTVYVNMVGGQDELVFDGQSLVIDTEGNIAARGEAFQSELLTVELSGKKLKGKIASLETPEKEAMIYKALVCGLKDYVEKNNFPGVLLGLSGGIDSALTLSIAVDALGASRVHPVMMPSRFTADISVIDAEEQIKLLGVKGSLLSIEPAFKAFLETLKSEFAAKPIDTTEENIQARIRAILLMALSNKSGNLLLTTSNKSESAVGYTTLYGDMAGGFAPLKDILKTEVYQLAHYRNHLSKVIPDRVLRRAPTAELKADQNDQDTLPDYAILDAILTLHIEDNLMEDAIIQKGFKANEVQRILNMIKKSEHKRKQAPPGIKVSTRAFGKDWRFPISAGD